MNSTGLLQDLAQLQSYDPWGKPGAGAPRVTNIFLVFLSFEFIRSQKHRLCYYVLDTDFSSLPITLFKEKTNLTSTDLAFSLESKSAPLVSEYFIVRNCF
jgi:hypothetical protein